MQMKTLWNCLAPVVVLIALEATPGPAKAEIVEYYVGRDGLAAFTSGAYNGLTNPNLGRLTLLYAHGDHFHGIGTFSYVGTPPAHVIEGTNSNNRIPESSAIQPPLSMRPGTGLYAGKLVTQHDPAEHYSNLNFRSIQDLSTYANPSPEYTIFHSSVNRWSGSLDGAQVAIELVSKSPGLGIGTDSLLSALTNPGDRLTLGPGNSLNELLTFWTDESVAPGSAYSAQFKLVDLSPSGIAESGTFNFDVRTVPEPSALTLMVVCGGLAVWQFRRRSRKERASVGVSTG
jgi:hypothetical protein